jgi:hypothetical protein
MVIKNEYEIKPEWSVGKCFVTPLNVTTTRDTTQSLILFFWGGRKSITTTFKQRNLSMNIMHAD